MNGNSHYVAGQMRLKLQELLDEKERQLQQAGALGQRILAQQVELEERINQISELDSGALGHDDDVQSEVRTKLDDLAATMHQWTTENETLWSGLSPKDAANDQRQIPQFEEETEQPVSAGPSAAQSSRRAKNAAHRAKDVEFAYEIGSSLLTEVRRLQSLLAERDKSLQDMKEEKDDLERSLDSLRTALRTQEANADKYKEENWNLEVSLQELRSQLSEAQGNIQRTETENKRSLRQIAQIQKTADDHKNEAERIANLLEDVRSKHETDVAQMRKQQSTLQREKVDLQTAIDSLKAEMAKKTKTIGRFGSPMTPNDPKFLTPGPTEYADEEDDVFGTAASNRRKMDSSLVFTDGFGSEIASSPEVSPMKSPIPNQTASELEALKQSLAHAHRQIGTLKNSLMREKQLRTDYGRKLADMGTSVAEPSDEDDYEDEPGELPRVTPLRRGRGRARVVTRGNRVNNNLAQKLALAAKSGPFEESTGPDLPLAEFSTAKDLEAGWVNVDEGAREHGIEDDDEFQDDDEQKRLSTLSVASIDGMDPAFANVLKQSHDTPASSSSRPIESKRSRGGAPFRRGESRPASILNAPGALAAELGLDEEPRVIPEPVISREEMGIQCDLLLPPIPPIQSTIAIQTDIVTVDSAIQTSQITTENASVSTEPARLRSYAHAGANTDAETNVSEGLDKESSGPIMMAEPLPLILSTLGPRHPPSSYKSPETLISKHDTDTEDETEYEDARETVTGTTPAESLVDLQSVDSFVEGSSDSDAESIKVSRLHVKRPSGPAPPVEQHEEVVATRILKETGVEVRPVLKEVAAQTEEWAPPLPPGTALFAVGPQAQQFQFIASPTSASTNAAPTSPTLKSQQGQLHPSASNTALSDGLVRSRAPSGTLSVNPSPKVDRSRPPTMMLPPPPRLPPPPIKAGPLNMGPPPRPTSPPPAELIQRAATPTMSRNSTLVVPIAAGRGGALRQSSTVSSAAPARQGKSNGHHHVGQDDAMNLQDPFDDNAGHSVPRSMPSLNSSRRSVSSRRMSISSSISSDHAIRMLESPAKMGASTPGAVSAGESATDPSIIHSITQTMIGEYLYKYTRKTIGKGHAERRHRRYFWIHPYTKTIYWSSVDPGSSNVTESSAKSAYIESVKAVLDPNPMPPGLHQYSVVVTTANREMKFTAPTKERHDIWFNALNYLLARPTPQPGGPTARAPLSPTTSNQPRTQNEENANRKFDRSPRSQRSVQSALTAESPNGTPKVQRSQSRMSNPYGSIGKRSGTAAAEYLRWNEAPTSPTAVQAPVQDTDFHIHDDHDAAYDGLENVRACCDGKHDVGSLSSRHHHHPQHHHLYHQGTVRSTSDAPLERPGSPSGWSFRSSRSKGGSQEGGTMFSWSRRSRKGSGVRP